MTQRPSVDPTFNHSIIAPMTTSLQRNNWVAVSNVQAPFEPNITVEEEVTKCFQILTGRFIKFDARL
jgi:hypothetical protein